MSNGHSIHPRPDSNLSRVRHIVVVASGKGGVGKSTTAVNLALALSRQGHKTGLFDADIYGPSQPLMLGIAPGTRPEIEGGKFMLPVEAHGIKCNSVGLLVDENQAMVWRGPMVVGAFNQILNDTRWGELDFLIVDMPPGTGDIQLTLAQRATLSGAVIVTTPQDIALLDARKGIEMFQKVDVPVLGLIENMAAYVCTACGHVEPLFGEQGGEALAGQYGVPLLGQIPLDRAIRECADAGQPIVVVEPDGAIAGVYQQAATAIMASLGQRQPAQAPVISMGD